MVIQRWQSVLLFVAAIFMTLYSFMNLCNIEVVDNLYSFSTLGIEDTVNSNTIVPSFYLFVISILSAVLSFVAIFMYANMKLQKILCRINAILILAIYAVTILVVDNAFPEAHFEWRLPLSFPAIALILTFIANRLIVSDENKLKSYDRIR